MKTAKEEIHSEIRQRDDDPISGAFRKFNEALYNGHPYGKDPTGTEADVEGLTFKELKELVRAICEPGKCCPRHIGRRG